MNNKRTPKIFAITNRRICQENFLNRIEKLARTPIDGIVLREKDLSENDYEELARDVLAICRRHGKVCILHFFPEIALRIAAEGIHLPLWKAAEYKDFKGFKHVGVSIHSLHEAKEAQNLGATYITAGHVFETECKQNLPPRGLSLLKSVCENVQIPVFGIGGIDEKNIQMVLDAGTNGVCLMSSLMKCNDPIFLVDRLKSACQMRMNSYF